MVFCRKNDTYSLFSIASNQLLDISPFCAILLEVYLDSFIFKECIILQNRTIGVSERLPLLETLPLSLQHLFAMFGSTVLVPILFHVNPATVLLFNGIGTLLYLTLCKGKIPAYLGSSFAFLSPVFLVLG